jgi:adenylate cyclase
MMAETRKIAAILAADVVGFSRMAGADEDGTLARLRTLRSELIDPAVASQNGHVFKRTGDGVLVEFRSVVEAVRCAITIQKAMIERNVSAPGDLRIDFRIGIHLGDVVEESDGDLMGNGVNIAARLEGVAQPGSICLSEDAYRQVRSRLEVAVTDLGTVNLKNIAEPIRVYSIDVGKPAASAAPGSAAVVSGLHPEPVDRLSIAVLPFEVSGGEEARYLAEGIVDDIIAALSRFKPFTVIDRNSSFAIRDRTLESGRIGEMLGVRYLLGGGVRISGQRLRFSTRLIDAGTGAAIWAENFDGGVDDVFTLQDAIAATVVNSIEPKLIEAEIAKVRRKPPSNWTAYDHYLRGVSLAAEFTFASIDAAAEEFRAALALDRDFAAAHAMLAADVITRRFAFGQPLDEAAVAFGRSSVFRAMELAPEDARVLAIAAFFLAFMDDALERAGAIGERAISVNPNSSDGWMVLGWVRTWLGNPEGAREAFERSLRLNPISKRDQLQILPGFIVICFVTGRDDERLKWANRLLAIDPSNLTALIAALDVAIIKGKASEAAALRQRLLQSFPTVRSAQLRDLFLRYRKPEHRALFEAFLARLGLPA